MLRDGGFVVNPQVNILLTQAYGNLVSVIGEVNTAGRYSLDRREAPFSMLAARRCVGKRWRSRDRQPAAQRQAFRREVNRPAVLTSPITETRLPYAGSANVDLRIYNEASVPEHLSNLSLPAGRVSPTTGTEPIRG